MLDAKARAALNRQLLIHTLEVIEEWRGDLAQCVVVSPCEEALTCARAFSFDGVLDVERGIPERVALDLAARGHRVVRRSEGPRRADGPLGAGQAVWIGWAEGVLTGGADPRKDSAAIGY